MAREIYICLGNSKSFKADLLAEAAARETTNWTISSEARPGDGALFYFTDPDSSILVRGTVLTRPVCDRDRHSEWEGYYFADIGDLETLAVPVTRRGLLRAHPGWGYMRGPQRSARVRPEYVRAMAALFDRPTLSDLRAEAAPPALKAVTMGYGTRRMFTETMLEVEERREEMVGELAGYAAVTRAEALLHVHANSRLTGVTFDGSLDALHAYYSIYPVAGRRVAV